MRVITRSLCSGNDSDHWKNVLYYWFSPGAEKKWFHGGAQVDEEIRQKFSSLVSENNDQKQQEVAIGYIPAWMGEEHGFQRTGLTEGTCLRLFYSLWLFNFSWQS